MRGLRAPSRYGLAAGRAHAQSAQSITLTLCQTAIVPTVNDLLRQPELALLGVHLPAPGIELRWVATSELADPAPFLEGGEVLLTTGLATRAWSGEWRGYVARLVDAGVVALGIGVGLTHARPPETLVGTCRELGLNLFEVPRATPFVAVSRAAARLLAEGEEATAREALEMQRQLTRAALRQDEPAVLLASLGGAVDGAAALLSRDGQLEVGPLGPRRVELDLALAQTEVDRIRPQGLRAAASVSVVGATTVVQPVGLAGQPSAYVAVHVPGRITEGQRGAVTTAVALLSLAAASRSDRRETDRRLRTAALELLVQADSRTAEIMLAARSGAAGQAAGLPRTVQLLRATGTTVELDDALAWVEEWELAALVGDELWVVAPPSRATRLGETLGERGLLVGIGGAEPSDRAGLSHASAGHALDAASEAAPVVSWDRLVGEGAMTVLEPTRAAAFAEAFLAPLADRAEGELIVTLQSFLRHHGSRLKVAEELGVHRNTVRNRVAQMEGLLGRSLDEPHVRVSAWIALQVRAESAE